MIKAVFTDVDGTLIDRQQRVLPGTLAAIRRLEKQGIPFVIMSGRGPTGIYTITDEYALSCPLAAFSGGLLQDADRSIIYSSTIPLGLAQKVIDFIEGRGFDCVCSIFAYDQWIVKDAADPRVVFEANTIRLVPTVGGIDEVLPAPGTGVREVHKVLGMCGDGKLDHIQTQVAEAFPQLCVTRSSDRYLEVMPFGASKGDAVQRFCALWGIDPKDAAAFGDHYNDLPMLQAVGHPFLMGNAPESLKAELGLGNGSDAAATAAQLQPSACIPEGFLAPVTLTADCDHEGIAKGLAACSVFDSAFDFITLRERPGLMDAAAEWFHEKWGVPKEAYLECMSDYLSGRTEYGWYLCLCGSRIAGGMGVIENDFHDRRDLAPNVCAVYTEEEYRCLGIAGRLLDLVYQDMKSKGILPLYLLTDHTGFYERYGWQFLCFAQGDGEPAPSRMYIKT